MNTSEHIVESYFRLVKKCFTISDVKVIGGVNRQCDLLAFDVVKKESFHVESSVTHEQAWIPTLEKITSIIEHKFLGYPRDRLNAGPNTDLAKGKNYFNNIMNTYKNYGLNPRRIRRVICVWDLKVTLKERNAYLREKERQYKLPLKSLSFLLFRDEVLLNLIEAVGKSNYDDEILRTFSLIKQYNHQTKQKRT